MSVPISQSVLYNGRYPDEVSGLSQVITSMKILDTHDPEVAHHRRDVRTEPRI